MDVTLSVTGRRRRASWVTTLHWLPLPAVAWIAIFLVLPIVSMTISSLAGPQGLSPYYDLIATHAYARISLRTVAISAITTIVCLVLAYPYAYAISNARSLVKHMLVAAVVMPYLTSSIVRTFAWQVLLSRNGVVALLLRYLGIETDGFLFTPAAVIIGVVHIQLPIMVLALVSVMGRIDRSTVGSARCLGAGPARAFLEVFLPQTAPGAQAGATLVFVTTLGAFVTPSLLGGQSGTMLSVVMQIAVQRLADFDLAAAGAVLLTGMTLLVLVAYTQIFAARLEWLADSRSAPASHQQGGRHLWRRTTRSVLRSVGVTLDGLGISRSAWPLWVLASLTAFFLLAPTLVTIPLSLSPGRTMVFPPVGFSAIWFQQFLTPDWLQPLATSVIVGTIVAISATFLGCLAAIGLESNRGAVPLAAATRIVLLLPIVVPSVIVAVAFYLMFVRIGLTGSIIGLSVAHIVLVLPFAFIITSGAVRAIDPIYGKAASSLGAGRVTILRRVFAPLLRPALLSAAFLSFVLSFDEPVVSIFISGIDVKTLPRRMFEALSRESDPRVAVVGVVSLGLTVIVLLATSIRESVRVKRGRTA